jgi:hypothetical protein
VPAHGIVSPSLSQHVVCPVAGKQPHVGTSHGKLERPVTVWKFWRKRSQEGRGLPRQFRASQKAWQSPNAAPVSPSQELAARPSTAHIRESAAIPTVLRPRAMFVVEFSAPLRERINPLFQGDEAKIDRETTSEPTIRH